MSRVIPLGSLCLGSGLGLGFEGFGLSSLLCFESLESRIMGCGGALLQPLLQPWLRPSLGASSSEAGPPRLKHSLEFLGCITEDDT